MWFDGKLRLSCFGKLRIYSDFIEPVESAKIVAPIRSWLVAGSASAARRVPDGQLPRLAYRLLVPETGGRHVVAGVVWPSADAVGRFFPFTVCTRIARRRLALGSLAELPLAVAPLWTRIQELAVTPGGDPLHLARPDEMSVSDVQELVRDARLSFRPAGEVRAELDAELARLGADEYLERLLGKAFWVLLPRVLWETLGVAGRLLETGEGYLGLRVPASERLNAVEQAAFWLRLLGGVLDGGGAPARLPVLILPVGQPADTGLWILFRDLLSQDLDALIGATPGHDYLVDLRRPDLPRLAGESKAHFERFSELLQDRISGSANALEFASLPLTELLREAHGSSVGS